MKIRLQDDARNVYEYEVPDGTDENYVIHEASKKEGVKLKKYVPPSAPERDDRALERMLDTETSARRGHETELERLRGQIDSVSSERDRLADELKAAHSEGNKLSLRRMDADGRANTESAKHHATQQALAAANAATAKAEAKCAALQEQLKTARVDKQKTGYVVHEIRRSENGFLRGFEITPK